MDLRHCLTNEIIHYKGKQIDMFLPMCCLSANSAVKLPLAGGEKPLRSESKTG